MTTPIGARDVREMPHAPKVKIEVTKENIELAARGSSSHCMIADAIKARFPDAKFVSVDVATIRWTDALRGLRYVYLTPRTAQHRIILFDRGAKFGPFSFRLQCAQVVAARGEPKKVRKGQRTKQRKALRQAAASKRAKLVRETGVGSGNVPHLVGGRTPPRIGTRREFGLRALS